MTSDEIITLGLATERLLTNEDFVRSFHAVLDEISRGLMGAAFNDDLTIKTLMARKEGVTYALQALNSQVEAMRFEIASNSAANEAQSENEFGFDDDESGADPQF